MKNMVKKKALSQILKMINSRLKIVPYLNFISINTRDELTTTVQDS